MTTSSPTSTTGWVTTSSSGEVTYLTEDVEGVVLAVWVVPGAQRSGVAGIANDELRVRLAAPAREGRANRELSRYLAHELGVAESCVRVVAGRSGRRKLVRIQGVRAADVAALVVS